VAHKGLPGQGPGWAGEWFAFTQFMAYTWNWNLPSRLLVPLLMDLLPKKQGTFPTEHPSFHDSGDYALIHSVLFFDSLVAHLRFDGLSNEKLILALGEQCEFAPGECTLAWAGAFPSFLISPFCEGGTPKADWKLIDSNSGVVKQGKYTTLDVMEPTWKKPSDLPKTNLPKLIAKGDAPDAGKRE